MLGPPLQLPIAETYLCHRRGGVTCLRTDPTTVIDWCDCSLLSVVLISSPWEICRLVFSSLYSMSWHYNLSSIQSPFPESILTYSWSHNRYILLPSPSLIPSLLQGYIIKYTHPLTPECQPSDLKNHTALSSDPSNDRWHNQPLISAFNSNTQQS